MPAYPQHGTQQPMSNIENLKKQAKALVRLHRAGSYHLAIVARDFLTCFAGMSDQEILAADFRLADAQELIARQHGCANWAELRARSATSGEASHDGPPDPPHLILAEPYLYVADVPRALVYYEQVMGFRRSVCAGEPPFYARVERGGAVLSLRFVHRPAIDPTIRAEETMLLQASVRVSNVKSLYLEFLAAGAVIDAPLRREPWGAWDFVVRDPDGNLIAFHEPEAPV